MAVALLLAVAVGLAGCGKKSATEEFNTYVDEAPPSTAGAPAGRALAKQAASGEGEAAVSPADRKIITTGSMELEVKDLDAALVALGELVTRSGGFYAGKTVSRLESWRKAEVTVRVPAGKFGLVHDGAAALGEVERDEQEGEDVTRQWQDLEARLRIRKAEEEGLLRLMGRQGRLADLIQVEKRLWEVREQIEVSEGELRYLRDQVTLATLTVALREQVPVAVGPLGAWNLGYHVVNAFHTLGRVLRGLAVGLIYVALPGAVVWVPLLLIIRAAVRRRRARAERLAAPPPPSQPAA
jgi:hypothetical protein